MFRSILCWLLLAGTCCAQQIGSAEGARIMAEIENARRAAIANWNASEKITYLKAIPKLPPPSTEATIESVNAGWTGDIGSFQFKVLSIVDASNMLLSDSKRIVWITDYPSKDFVDGQSVRVYGPVKAGETKTYDTAAGSSKTIRTFSLIKDQAALDAYEQTIGDFEILVQIRPILESLVWGNEPKKRLKDMDKKTLNQYRNVTEKVERQLKAGKIDAAASAEISIDKKGKVEFKSEKAKQLALDEIKKLIAEIPK